MGFHYIHGFRWPMTGMQHLCLTPMIITGIAVSKQSYSGSLVDHSLYMAYISTNYSPLKTKAGRTYPTRQHTSLEIKSISTLSNSDSQSTPCSRHNCFRQMLSRSKYCRTRPIALSESIWRNASIVCIAGPSLSIAHVHFIPYASPALGELPCSYAVVGPHSPLSPILRMFQWKDSPHHVLATIGLGVSDFVHRISHYSFQWFQAWVRKHLVFMDYHGLGAQAWPWQKTVYQEECINTALRTAIALQSIQSS